MSPSPDPRDRRSHATGPPSANPFTPLPPNPSSTLLPLGSPLRPGRGQSGRQSPSEESIRPESGSSHPENAAPDDALSAAAMAALLRPSHSNGPALSWSARQAREKRRRDIIQLQRWVQDEIDRIDQACDFSESSHSSVATLRSSVAACDQAVGELARLIAVAGAAGGDDVAAEVLTDVWRAAGKAAARQQERLRAELAAAKKRAAAAAAAAEAAVHRQSHASRGSREGSISGKESGSGSQDGEPGAAAASTEGETPAGGSGEALTQHFVDAHTLSAAVEAATVRLKDENAKLEAALAACRRDLAAASQRAAVLESLAGEAVDAEARAAAAEAALEEAQQGAGTLTPRPVPSHAELRAILGEEGRVDMALTALQELPAMSPEELAALLVTTAVASNAPPPAAEAGAAQDQAPPSSQSPAFLPPPPTAASRFAGALAGVPAASLAEALARARGPTAARYTSLEATTASLRTQAASLAVELETHREAERRREAARRRREEEAALDRKNAVQQYLDLLSSQGEEAWREQLIGMGQGAEVPKLFRHSGKIRNKGMSKRETEKLVKELWKERIADPAVAAGRAGELVDFVGAYLQKRVGIAAAVIELGYNFLYGLWQYQWDADCELFLRILAGEIREEVYVAASRLQTDLEDLFAALDKAAGRVTGTLPKEDLRTALSSFFRVGAPGGKNLERFDEVMQALEADQPGPAVEWKKVFEEDREFNQGEFAECLRDQFLKERIEFFKALEEALYEEAAGGGAGSGGDGDEECTKAQVVRAVLQTDPECSEKAAAAAVGAVFVPGTDTLSIKVVMRKLSRGIMRGGGAEDRASLGAAGNGRNPVGGKNSVMVGRGRASNTGGNGAAGKTLLAAAKRHNPAIDKALEAVRVEWIKRQLETTTSAKKGEDGGGGGGEEGKVVE